MKISVSNYSYSQWRHRDGKTIFDCMDHAKRFADGFEFANLDCPDGREPLDYAKELRAYADKIGLPIVCYSICANMLAEDLDAEVARVCREVDIAEALGCPVMRHDVADGFPKWYTGIKTFGSVLPRLAEGCRRITEYAAQKGIRTCSENHGTFFQRPERMIALIEAVDNSNYGLLCDMGNFLCGDAESIVSVGEVAAASIHVHAKDFLLKKGECVHPGDGWFCTRGGDYLRGTVIGHGVVPVAQDVRILKNSGYNGYITCEFEGMERCPEAIEIGCANLRRYIKAAE